MSEQAPRAVGAALDHAALDYAALDYAVLVAGGGPTGLMLAAELALAGVEVAVLERRSTQEVEGSRALGLLPRTIEVLDQRGVAERFLDAGQVVSSHGYGGIRFDISDLATRHSYVLALPQSRFEPLLADWVAELGVAILRNCEVTDCVTDGDGVEVRLSGGRRLRGGYLVGCDGGRSRVRNLAGIDFVGVDPSTSWMIAEATMTEEPQLGFRDDEFGTHALGRAPGRDRVRVLLTEREVQHGAGPGLQDLRGALVDVYGTDFGLRSADWISRFTDATRQAVRYRRGRILLAGDAAHVHPPQGGQGMQTGVQDGVNLGWKLAQVVHGTSPDDLLDTYHAERHPVGARVLDNTLAQVALGKPGPRHRALRDTMAALLAMDEPRRYVAAMLTGLDIHYDLGADHPLVGWRIPDLDLQGTGGSARLYSWFHDARPVLLGLTGPGGSDLAFPAHPSWTDRIRVVQGRTAAWQQPGLGQVSPPAAVLIRPDGHVAWAGEPTSPELPNAIARWFGGP